MVEETPKKVFISYSWKPKGHKSKTLKLTNCLRRDRVDCMIDQGVFPQPDQGWILWIQQQVENADFVIVVCSQQYKEAEQSENAQQSENTKEPNNKPGKGVAWEAKFIRDYLYNERDKNKKIIPIAFEPNNRNNIPFGMRSSHNFYELLDEIYDPSVPGAYQDLLRHIHGKPYVKLAPLGKMVPDLPLIDSELLETGITGQKLTQLSNSTEKPGLVPDDLSSDLNVEMIKDSFISEPGGETPRKLGFYVERIPYEDQCYNAILSSGALLRIKAPQHMGKTLLIARVLRKAKQQGYKTVTLSFELADRNVFTNLHDFSKWFCATVGQILEMPNKLIDYWDEMLSYNYNITTYFQNYLFARINNPIVLTLDKVDLVFEHREIAEDFCNLLRGWHEQARYDESSSKIWEKLRLVIVHSTEVYGSLNINKSPLGGVGEVVELPEFKPEEIQKLANQYKLNWNATQFDQLRSMIGGHPYLVREAFEHISQQKITLERLLKTAATEAGLYKDHLRRLLENLQMAPDLATEFSKVVMMDKPVKLRSEIAFKLYSMGLVHINDDDEVIPRCKLYREYFRNHLAVN